MIALGDSEGSLSGARLEVAEVQKSLVSPDVFPGADATLAPLRWKLQVPGV